MLSLKRSCVLRPIACCTPFQNTPQVNVALLQRKALNGNGSMRLNALCCGAVLLRSTLENDEDRNDPQPIRLLRRTRKKVEAPRLLPLAACCCFSEQGFACEKEELNDPGRQRTDPSLERQARRRVFHKISSPAGCGLISISVIAGVTAFHE